jgi:hypothetical protein
MSDEEKKPARPIGSAVDRYRKLGQSKQPEAEKSGEQDSVQPQNPVTSQSAFSESQISSNSDNSNVEYSESQKSGISDNQKVEGNRKVVTYTREKKPERKAQIIYLPPDVKDRLKLYAVRHKREISEIVTDLVVAFLEKEENK